jgi:putative FmdB family regulatory protein
VTYDYVCDKCKAEITVEQRITEPPLRQCPKCKRRALARQISGVGAFQLQGSGWGKDGYK